MGTGVQARLGIALGGGAALGYAHIGVLKVLAAEGLFPDCIAGTSMGALVGGAAASWASMDEVERRFRVSMNDPYIMELDLEYLDESDKASTWDNLMGKVKRGVLLTQSVMKDSIIGKEVFERILRNLLPDRNIDELPVPFACVSTNLQYERRTLWTRGRLLDAVAASCAIPGIFPHFHDGAAMHVDGGSVENIPVRAAREIGSTLVLAVSVEEQKPPPPPEVAVDFFLRAGAISRRALVAQQLANADLVVAPPVAEFHWSQFRDLAPLVACGERAASQMIDELKYVWQDHQRGFKKGIWSFIFRPREIKELWQ